MSSQLSVSVSIPSANRFIKKIQRTASIAIRKVTNKINNVIGGFGVGLSMGGGYQDSALADLFYSSGLGVEPGEYQSGYIEELFADNQTYLWENPSVYGPSEMANQSPYSWVKLTDSDKYDRINDTQASPIGSIARDSTRVSKLMASGTGTLFSDRQTQMQKLNAFTEAREWNVDSIIQSTQRMPGELRVSRHIENEISGIATDASPSGVSPAISLSVKSSGQMLTSGFIRGETGNRARNLFSAIWQTEMWGASTAGNDQQSTTNKEDANWKLRPEYTDDENKNVFKAFLTDKPTLLSYSVGDATYTVTGVHKYYSIGSDVRRYSPRARVIQYPSDKDARGVSNKDSTGKIIANQKLLATGKFNPNTSNGIVGIKRDEVEFSLETDDENTTRHELFLNGGGEGYQTNLLEAATRWDAMAVGFDTNVFFRSQLTYKQRMETASSPAKKYGNIKRKSSLEQSKKFAGAQKVDDYNMLGVLSGNPKELFGATRNESADTIFFYFYDLINDKYIPFRATITGISENTSTDWDNVQYMGRADKLLTYNGFSREMNFGFHVNANSVRELIPMWNRINYLSGLNRPAKYTSAGNGLTSMAMANFIYPPLIRITIGDLYSDQPGVISSFGITIPDDSPWETVRVGTDKQTGTYTYLEDTPQAIRIDNVISRQLPLNVNISISMKLLEKELAMTNKNLYFDPTQLSKHTGI